MTYSHKGQVKCCKSRVLCMCYIMHTRKEVVRLEGSREVGVLGTSTPFELHATTPAKIWNLENVLAEGRTMPLYQPQGLSGCND